MYEINSNNIATFGDGNTAKIINMKEVISPRTQRRIIRFIFIPSKKIEETYNIADEQDPQTRAIIKEYPFHEVIILDRDVNRMRVWVICNFDGTDSPASRHYELLETALETTEQLLISEKAAKARMHREYLNLAEHTEETLKAQSDLFKLIKQSNGRSENIDDNFEGDE
jgi:hypothetical protein